MAPKPKRKATSGVEGSSPIRKSRRLSKLLPQESSDSDNQIIVRKFHTETQASKKRENATKNQTTTQQTQRSQRNAVNASAGSQNISTLAVEDSIAERFNEQCNKYAWTPSESTRSRLIELVGCQDWNIHGFEPALFAFMQYEHFTWSQDVLLIGHGTLNGNGYRYPGYIWYKNISENGVITASFLLQRNNTFQDVSDGNFTMDLFGPVFEKLFDFSNIDERLRRAYLMGVYTILLQFPGLRAKRHSSQPGASMSKIPSQDEEQSEMPFLDGSAWMTAEIPQDIQRSQPRGGTYTVLGPQQTIAQTPSHASSSPHTKQANSARVRSPFFAASKPHNPKQSEQNLPVVQQPHYARIDAAIAKMIHSAHQLPERPDQPTTCSSPPSLTDDSIRQQDLEFVRRHSLAVQQRQQQGSSFMRYEGREGTLDGEQQQPMPGLQQQSVSVTTTTIPSQTSSTVIHK